MRPCQRIVARDTDYFGQGDIPIGFCRLSDVFCNLLKRYRITFTTNGGKDYGTMFTLYLPLAVFSSQKN